MKPQSKLNFRTFLTVFFTMFLFLMFACAESSGDRVMKSESDVSAEMPAFYDQEFEEIDGSAVNEYEQLNITRGGSPLQDTNSALAKYQADIFQGLCNSSTDASRKIPTASCNLDAYERFIHPDFNNREIEVAAFASTLLIKGIRDANDIQKINMSDLTANLKAQGAPFGEGTCLGNASLDRIDTLAFNPVTKFLIATSGNCYFAITMKPDNSLGAKLDVAKNARGKPLPGAFNVQIVPRSKIIKDIRGKIKVGTCTTIPNGLDQSILSQLEFNSPKCKIQSHGFSRYVHNTDYEAELLAEFQSKQDGSYLYIVNKKLYKKKLSEVEHVEQACKSINDAPCEIIARSLLFKGSTLYDYIVLKNMGKFYKFDFQFSAIQHR